ncbi:MAG: helix-turn-helix transcriptional regulator [Hyphomicrobiaceae bacterium]
MSKSTNYALHEAQATEAKQSSPLDTLLSIGEVTTIVGASRSTIYAWLKQGLFPPPIRIGPRRVAWRTSEIQAWIDSRPRARAGPV